MNLSTRDLEILNELYRAGKPISVADIAANQNISLSTTHVVIRNFLKEELIVVAGTALAGKRYTRLYIPNDIAKEKILNHFKETFIKTRDIISAEDITNVLKQSV